MRLPAAVSGLRAAPEDRDPDIDVVWAQGPEPPDGEVPEGRPIALRQRAGGVPLYRAWRVPGAAGPDYLWTCAGPARALKYRLQPLRGRIEVWPNPEVSTLTLLRPAFGQALAFMLRARGRLLLHAAGVRIADAAALIVGPSGSGKSTLLLDLLGRGGRFLGDDMALVQWEAGAPVLQPGHGSVKLAPQSLARLGAPRAAEWPLAAGGVKREMPVDPPPPNDAVALKAIFLLEPRETLGRRVAVEPVPAGEALGPLLANVHPAYLPVGALDPAEGGALFVQLSNLVARVAVFRLRRPDALELAPQAGRRLLEAVAAL